MKVNQIYLLDWQQQYGIEKACAQALALQRLPGAYSGKTEKCLEA